MTFLELSRNTIIGLVLKLLINSIKLLEPSVVTVWKIAGKIPRNRNLDEYGSHLLIEP